jgi:hypothetical protein
VLARDSMDMVKDSEARLGAIAEPTERIIEGMLFCLDEIPRRPLHAHLFQDSGQWVASQTMPADQLFSIAQGMLNNIMGVSQLPEPLRRQVDDLAEWVLRALISYAMVPSHRARNRDEMRRFLHAMLDPTIKAVLGSVPAAKKTSKPTGRKKS